MRISPDMNPEDAKKAIEMDRKRNQDLLDFMTIALNSDSENSFEEARKTVFGD